MAMEVAFGTGMLIGWMRVRYVPHDEGDGTGSENVHNFIQRSYSLLTLGTLSTKQDRSLTELDCRNGQTTFYCVSPVAAIILSCPEQAPAASIGRVPGDLQSQRKFAHERPVNQAASLPDICLRPWPLRYSCLAPLRADYLSRCPTVCGTA